MAQCSATCPHAEAKAAIEASLGALFDGTFLQKVKDLIASGLTELPAILSALTAAGVALPPWATLVINLLLALEKPATA
jgi:hypothetical protein